MSILLKNRMKLTDVAIFEDSENFIERVLALGVRPDIVFLDIHVQPHNGFEMLAMLRARPELRGVPVVALTASVMNEEVLQIETAGFNGCLGKPLDLDAFPEMMNRILDGERLWRPT